MDDSINNNVLKNYFALNKNYSTIICLIFLNVF